MDTGLREREFRSFHDEEKTAVSNPMSPFNVPFKHLLKSRLVGDAQHASAVTQWASYMQLPACYYYGCGAVRQAMKPLKMSLLKMLPTEQSPLLRGRQRLAGPVPAKP